MFIARNRHAIFIWQISFILNMCGAYIKFAICDDKQNIAVKHSRTPARVSIYTLYV